MRAAKSPGNTMVSMPKAASLLSRDGDSRGKQSCCYQRSVTGQNGVPFTLLVLLFVPLELVSSRIVNVMANVESRTFNFNLEKP